jgi:purine-binding chemotaxis protein CheW
MTHAKDDRYLCFLLGNERFAIPLLYVREVIGVPEFTRMPFAPSYFKGLLNLRGQVIATLDLRLKFQIQSKPAETNQTSETTAAQNSENAVIVCVLNNALMGSLVDSVDFVFRAAADSIQTHIDVESSMKTDYIAGLYNHKVGLVIMLDLQKVLSIHDIQAIENPVAALKETA